MDCQVILNLATQHGIHIKLLFIKTVLRAFDQVLVLICAPLLLYFGVVFDLDFSFFRADSSS